MAQFELYSRHCTPWIISSSHDLETLLIKLLQIYMKGCMKIQIEIK